MPAEQSSWKVASWVTPQTEVTVDPIDASVSPESRTKISDRLEEQIPQFIRDDYPDFIQFIKYYYQALELKGNPVDVIQNIDEYYNIDRLNDLVESTTASSGITLDATVIDVGNTRDFPKEGLISIDEEIIYYKSKSQTQFKDCVRGFHATTKVGTLAEYTFSSSEAATHAFGATVINLNNLLPLFLLQRFRDQFAESFPSKFDPSIAQSSVTKRLKDFYASKGTSRSFKYLMRVLFGVESVIQYPKDRIFKPSDAFYTVREIIRATAISGNPVELTGEVLYQENDPNDTNVNSARIYVKSVVEVFTEDGKIYELDVDTENGDGTFTTPYKTLLSEDLSSNLTEDVVSVDSTIGWPETGGSIRIDDEIINYTDKTVTQFLGCTRARHNSTAAPHISGSDVTSSYEIFGYSNRDQSKISLTVFGGTRGIDIVDGGKYYLQDSKVTTPSEPGFDSLDPIWESFVYNVKKLLNGTSLVLDTPLSDGSVVANITTEQIHGLKREDTIVILNAPEDVYNSTFTVRGVSTQNTFSILIPTTPIRGVDVGFLVTREFAKSTSTDTSIRLGLQNTPSDVQNVYKSSEHAIIASPGVPGHNVGPFHADDLDPNNQRYLKRIPLSTTTKSVKTATPVGQNAIGVNGVPFFSYKSNDTKLFGGVKSITVTNSGSGYDITNPPIVEFEPIHRRGTSFFLNQRIRNTLGYRYRNLGSGKTAELGSEPTHTGTDPVQDGTCLWQYEGLSAEATVSVSGSLFAVNVDNGGSGYTTAPTVGIVGGDPTVEASATATITSGVVTAISVSAAGSGYSSVPTVVISGGGGEGAAATAVVRGGLTAEGITITNNGSNYNERPNITLVSGSGAVGYPSIVNGRIVSIILTFGGSNYYGAPDVIISGDGVGAVAFASVDSGTQQVTGITVTNGGIGYTSGTTTVDIVYPGSGATFQVELPVLTKNLAASADEVGDPLFVNPKQADDANGVSIRGANFGIYGGEYGYLYNPKKLRFLLGDNVSDTTYAELNPTNHSPIIGWSFDGHPIYGPYGYTDRENKNPYNELKQMISSYRIRANRDTLVGDDLANTDKMGTYIEDYEYVEGLGDLDQYNGRFCVTPDYPLGVYAYFCTLDGTTGNPKFPYFVGPNFYSEASDINWKGNGLQRNFTEDAVRYKRPYVATDTALVRRKNKGNPVEYILALEDSTTPIVLEDGSTFIGFVDVGIGYFDFFPTIRGGSVDSLFVAATNRYFSSGLDQYLIEGAGFNYKVNDRLIFDETSTGGSGVSARVSRISGSTTNALAFSVNSTTDIITGSITTGDTHYIKVGDTVDVAIGNNQYTRELDVKVINDKYHFKYFDLTNLTISSVGRIIQANITITGGTGLSDGSYTSVPLIGGTGSGASANITVSGNTVTSVSIQGEGKNYTDGDILTANTSNIGGAGQNFSIDIGNVKKTGGLVQNLWTFLAGSGGTPGTYTRVPLVNTSTSSGEGAEFTIVVNSSGEVSSVTLTKEGSGYYNNEQLDPVASGDIGGVNGFYVTPSQINQEFTARGSAAHQLTIGDEVVLTGSNPSDYDGTHTVTGISTGRRFQFKKAVGIITDTAITTACEVYAKEPKIDLINGHLYKFKTSDSSNAGKRLEFTFDKENTNVFTYKNIVDSENDTVTGEQISVTISLVDVPGTLFYFDINGNVAGSYLSVINDPFLGANAVSAVPTTTTIEFILAREPENNYTTANSISYSTDSIFPSGGIAAINVGDPGRNYATLPQFTGIERSGGGATAFATISGKLEDVVIIEAGVGYNGSNPPSVVCSMPDFVDLTISEIFGDFNKGDVATSKTVLDGDTARGKVISWDPNTSTLRVQPLRNNLTGATNRGFIMFSTGNANTNKIFAGSNQAVVSAVSGEQANVAAIVPTSGPEIGTISNIAINGDGGSNYRTAPEIFIDDPFYGGVLTLSVNSQNTSASFTPGTYTVSQESVAPTGGSNVSIQVIIDASTNDVTLPTVLAGGANYSLGDLITIRGEDITGGSSADDFVLRVDSLDFVRKAVTSTTIDASIDAVVVQNSGSGFLSAPEVQISGGTGIGAVLRAEIIDETVSSIVIESAGTRFQNPPIISVKQGTGTGASILLKSSDLGKIISLGGDNITYNYSHDRTLKPSVNTNYNLQLTRTQIVDFFTVTNGGGSFVTKPTIELVGGGGSGAVMDAIIDNEVIQAITVANPGRGYSSTPAVRARITHSFVPLESNSTLNFPYDTKIPVGTEVQLLEVDGTLPPPFVANTTYFAIAPTLANGLASNQLKMAASLADALSGTAITITGQPSIGNGGTATFNLTTTDLGDSITVTMTPASFAIGEKLYQGTSTDSFSAVGTVKAWDPKGRVLSVEVEVGEYALNQPVFGLQSNAFGEIHDFDRSVANFNVSPIATATAEFKRTTGILDLNDQRLYDSDRYQEFSYVVNSPINVREWKNQFKNSAHPAGFKVLGTQVVSQSAFKRYQRRSYYNPSNPDTNNWWEQRFGDENVSFNGTTFFVPKPSASNTGKLARIENFVLGKPDYTATVPTNIQVVGKQLLDVRKILSAVVDKIDSIASRTITFDGTSSSTVDVSNEQITFTNHGLITGQTVTYAVQGDRYQDARNLILANLDYIISETITWLELSYPNLTDGTKPDYNAETCARDLRLIVIAWCNDLRYGGNKFSVDAAESYIDGGAIQHIVGETIETIAAIQKARDYALQAVQNLLPTKDVTITTDPGGCADVQSAITVLSQIVWDAIDNPGNIPTANVGNYPNIREGVTLTGLTTGTYYVTRVDDNIFTLSATSGGSAVDITGLSTDSQHQLTVEFDDQNTKFQLRTRGVATSPTNKNQLMVTINGIVQNPESYTLSGSTITFLEAPIRNSTVIIMYFKRSDISTNFQLDQFGDVITALNTTDGIYQGTGYTAGTYNGVSFTNKLSDGSGATGNIIVTNVLDSASHVTNNKYGDARTLIDNNAAIIADVAVGLLNKYGTPTDNKVADGANLILMNKDFIAREAVDRMHLDIPYTISNKRHFDAYNLIQANKDFLVWEAYYLFKTIDFPGYTHAQGYTEQDCRDDLMDILEAIAFNLLFGANNKVYDASYYYTSAYSSGSVIQGEEQQTIAAVNQMKGLMDKVILNETVSVAGDHGYEQYFEDVTYIYDGCASAKSTISTLVDIVVTAINTDLMAHVTKTEPTLFVEPTGSDEDCVDDVRDVLEAIAINMKFGGNSEVYDAAKYYVDGAHVAGEEIHTIYAFREADKIAQQVLSNNAVTVVGDHSEVQKYDGGITRSDNDCAGVRATVNTLFNIVEVAVDTNTMSAFTRTAPTGFSVPGLGDGQCKSDTRDVLNSVGINVAFGGNHTLYDTLNMYFVGNHVLGEESETIYVFEEARQMVLKAINNESFETYPHLNLTTRSQFKDPTITAYSNYAQSFNVTGATYTATNGNVELTIGSHTLEVGTRIRLADMSLTFKCAMDGTVTHHKYPRSTDYAYRKSLPITAKTGTTITINVGTSNTVNYQITGANYDPATGDMDMEVYNTQFNVSAATYNANNGVMTVNIGSHSMEVGEEIMFRPNSLTFTCSMDGNNDQKTYPRFGKDPFYDKALKIISKDSNTITVNVGPSPLVNHTVTDATYDPSTGVMEATIGNHILKVGDTITITDNSLNFQCLLDLYTSDHTYPRTGDPASGDAIAITAVSDTTITMNVGTSSDTTQHRWKPGYVGTDAIQSGGGHTHTFVTASTGAVVIPHGLRSQRVLSMDSAEYNPTTGIMTVTCEDHGLTPTDEIIIDDSSVIFTCAQDGDGSDHAYPRGSDPISELWQPITDVTRNTFKVQVLNTAPSTNETAHTFKAVVAYNLHVRGQSLKIADGGITFTCDAATGTHTFVSGTTNGITAGGGASGTFTAATGTTYDPLTGVMEVEIGSHSLTTSNTVTFADGSVTFTCVADNNATNHPYPRASDPSSGVAEAITAVTATTITVNVGIAGSNSSTHSYPRTDIINHTVTGAVYTPADGDMVVTVVGHSMRKGDYVKFDDDSLTFTCLEDGNGSNHTYPRATDPVSGKWLRIRNVTADTFKVRVLDFIPSTNTTTHTFVSGTSNGLKQKKDQAYDQPLQIVRSSIDRITVNVGIAATNNSTHVYSSSLSNAITVGGNYTHTFLTATTGAVTEGNDGCTAVQATIDTLMDLAYTALTQGSFSGISRTVGNHGDGYETAPTIQISGGSPTTGGTYVPVLADRGYVKSIGIITGGVGYNNVPTVKITSNTGFNASGTATVSGGAVTGITVTEGGFGYNDVTVEIIANAADTITTTATAAAIVGRHLERIVVQETGAGYSSTPTLSLTGGSPATAAGTLNAPIARTTGAVTSVTLVSGGDGYKNTDILGVDAADVGGTVTNSFQVEVQTVTFNGTTTGFAATVGGSGYTLPANDRFLLFLNSHIQELGTSYSYSGTPSTIQFAEAPKGNMDFYCFYVGQLQDMDSIAPFMNGTKKTFILKKNDQPFSLESDSNEVIPANNLVMFLNGVYQEPEVAYTLDGSILTFSEAPRAESEVLIYIYTGSSLDIVTEDTFSALDPGDLLQVQSEGEIRRLATIASSSSLDTYEYTGLRPNVATFSATVVAGRVVQVTIVDAGSNYEVAPFLIFSGGGGSGAFAETIIEQGSGKVIGVTNLQGGSNYNTAPAVTPYHPLALERTQRDRAISNGVFLYTTQLTGSIGTTTATIPVLDAYYTNGVGFPTNGELLIPFWNNAEQVWGCERILYGSVDYSTEEFTVTTNGRGYKNTGTALGTGYANAPTAGTFVASGSTSVAITMGANHYLQTGMERFIRFTSAIGSYPTDSLNGTYKITRTGDTTYTITLPVNLNASGTMEILPTIRVYTV